MTFKPLRLQHFNHAVIMTGVLTQQIGPQHQNTDGSERGS